MYIYDKYSDMKYVFLTYFFLTYPAKRDLSFMDLQPHRKRLRVLLVEDYPLARSASMRALRDAFAVTAVASGEEALRWVYPGAFDALLTDFEMPAMTGIELIEWVRLRDPRLRRVLMSAAPVAALHGYMAVGLVHAFLAKPFDLSAARNALDPGGQ
jgi:two-component system, response regulator YesN